MVRFKRTKIYSKTIALMVFLYVTVLAILSIFVNTDNSIILSTAALTVNATDNFIGSASLIFSNTSLENILFWTSIILLATLLAFLFGKRLDKIYGKYYCVDCVRKNTYISVKSIK